LAGAGAGPPDHTRFFDHRAAALRSRRSYFGNGTVHLHLFFSILGDGAKSSEDERLSVCERSACRRTARLGGSGTQNIAIVPTMVIQTVMPLVISCIIVPFMAGLHISIGSEDSAVARFVL
jgi:hypothetical protein